MSMGGAGRRRYWCAWEFTCWHIERQPLATSRSVRDVENRCALAGCSFHKAHQAAGLQIGIEEAARLIHRGANGFSGEVTAAGGAFHGGGPAGCGPIAGEKAVGPR